MDKIKYLWSCYREAEEQLSKIGIRSGFVTEFSVNSRAKTRWGCCRWDRITNSFKIEISALLLEDGVEKSVLMDTLVHEVLHTVEGCMNHGPRWQFLANKVNYFYGYNVKRTTSAEEKGIELKKAEPNYKFSVTCIKCGTVGKYQRESKIVKLCKLGKPGLVQCACGGSLFQVEDLT